MHRSPGISLIPEENPEKLQLGDRLKKGLCEQSSHSASGREKEETSTGWDLKKIPPQIKGMYPDTILVVFVKKYIYECIFYFLNFSSLE